MRHFFHQCCLNVDIQVERSKQGSGNTDRLLLHQDAILSIYNTAVPLQSSHHFQLTTQILSQMMSCVCQKNIDFYCETVIHGIYHSNHTCLILIDNNQILSLFESGLQNLSAPALSVYVHASDQ